MKKQILTLVFIGTVGSALAAVNWNEVPQPVQQAIRAQKGDAKVQDYETRNENGQTIYHFTFDRAGQRHSVDVAQDGTVVRNSMDTQKNRLTRLEWNQVPAAVQQTVRQHKGTAKVDRIERDLINGHSVYRFNYAQGGRANELIVNEDGSLANGGQASTPGTVSTANTGNSGSTVTFKDLPWTIQKPMLDTTGYAKIETVSKINQNGQTVYVGTYQKDGRNQEIRVSENGTVLTGAPIREGAGASPLPQLSNASKVQFSDLPPAVRNTINAHANGAAVEDIDKGMLNGRVVYEAAFKKNGRTAEVRVQDDGSDLGEHFD